MTQSIPKSAQSSDLPERTDQSLFDDDKPLQKEAEEQSAPRPTYSRRAKVLLLCVTLGAMLLVLLLCELAAWGLNLAPLPRMIRLSDVNSPYQVSKNPILGYEIKKDYRNDKADGVVSFASSNSHGQRDIERVEKKPAGVRRILLLGDSVVESLEVKEIDDLMNRQLEMLYGDDKTEVLNFGVNGYCTLAEVELLRTKGLKFDPDMVVLVFVDNDFNNFNAAAGGTAANIEGLQRGILKDADYRKKSPVLRFFFEHSHLFRAVAMAGRQKADKVAGNRKALGDNNVVEGLEMLRKLADEQQFEVLIVIWPTFEEDAIVDRMLLRGSEMMPIEVLAAMYHFPTVRLSERFNEQWKSQKLTDNPCDFYTVGDNMHVKEVGSGAAAQVLKSVIDDYPQLKEDLPESIDPELVKMAVNAARELGRGAQSYDLVAAVVELGFALEKEDRFDEAIKFYEYALDLDPTSKVAHARLGNLYIKTGELGKGREHLTQAGL